MLKIAIGSSSGVDVTAKGKVMKKKGDKKPHVKDTPAPHAQKISAEAKVGVDLEVQVMDPPQKRARVENEPGSSILAETEVGPTVETSTIAALEEGW
ncbi:hypothetical protein SESBI_49298 [Sesbania bispinosa]|nr:hypothetical protein SESBI_49298 [Sesbania bispinosa]